MTTLSRLFENLRKDGRKAFIPFITAGDPDTRTTMSAVERLVTAGASLVEIGFPYSDPIADGPVIQASYTRALANKPTMDSLLHFCSTMSTNTLTASTPRVGPADTEPNAQWQIRVLSQPTQLVDQLGR